MEFLECQDPGESSSMKILVISLAGIGDTLFATPLIHELRANFPDATLDALVLWGGAKQVLEGNPHLNNIFQRNLLRGERVAAMKLIASLRRGKYDVSINTYPQSRIHYRFVAGAIRARQRLSHTYHSANLLDRWLATKTIPQSYEMHSIENNLALLGLLGKKPILPNHDYELYLSDAERAWASEHVNGKALKGARLMGVHVGSGGTKNLALRRWPLNSYEALFQKLQQTNPELRILLFGGPEEAEAHRLLMSEGQFANLMQPPTKSIRQAAALIARCDLFLSVDTSLMHVASGMKVPHQIVIETPSWNQTIAPYRNPYTLVPNPAVNGKNLELYRYDGNGLRGTDQQLRDWMSSVSVDSVHQAVTGALEK